MIYNIDFTEGCMAFSYLINNVEFIDFKDNKTIRLIINQLIEKKTNNRDVLNVIVDILENEIEYDKDIEDYHFDICGLWDSLIMMFNEESHNYEKYNEIQNQITSVLSSMSNDEFKQLKAWAIKLINDIVFNDIYVDMGWVQQILLDLVRDDKDTVYKCSDRPCECCGDYVENYKLTVVINTDSNEN